MKAVQLELDQRPNVHVFVCIDCTGGGGGAGAQCHICHGGGGGHGPVLKNGVFAFFFRKSQPFQHIGL